MIVKVKSLDVQKNFFQLQRQDHFNPIKYFMLGKYTILLQYQNCHQVWDLSLSKRICVFLDIVKGSIACVLPVQNSQFVYVSVNNNQIGIVKINIQNGSFHRLGKLGVGVVFHDNSYAITGTVADPLVFYGINVDFCLWRHGTSYRRTTDKAYRYVRYNDHSVVGIFNKQASKIQFQIHTFDGVTNYCTSLPGQITAIKQLSENQAAIAILSKNKHRVIVYSLAKNVMVKLHKTQLFITSLYIKNDNLFAIGKQTKESKQITCQQCYVKSKQAQMPFQFLQKFHELEYMYCDYYPAVSITQKQDNITVITVLNLAFKKSARYLFLLESLELDNQFGGEIYKAVYNNLI